MKKSLILVGMLAIGYANAQEGVVGINTSEPKATLQVTPSAENAKATATTNEGIMAPQLSKSRVAGIATPVEGTLVYVTDETTSPISAYTGADAKVAKITEKGYYFYNGTEWVKTSATDGGEWVHNGTDAIYAKRAKDATKSNLFEILDNGRTYTNQGNVDWRDVSVNINGLPSVSQDPRGSIANLTMMSSAILPLNDININKTNPNVEEYQFNGTSAYVYQAHAGTSNGDKKSYSLDSKGIGFKDVSSPIFYTHGLGASANIYPDTSSNFDHIRGSSFTGFHKGSGNVVNLMGVHGAAHTEGTGFVDYVRGVHGVGYVRKGSTANRIYGADFSAHLHDTGSQVNNYMYGLKAWAETQNASGVKIKEIGAATLNINTSDDVEYSTINGNRIENIISMNAKVGESLNGTLIFNYIKTTHSTPIVNGVKVNNVLWGKGAINDVYGYYSHLHNNVNGSIANASSNINNYYGFYTANDLRSNFYTGIITNSYDFYAKENPTDINLTNQYGLYILGAPKINYLQGNLGIGTNKPSEKLEVDGKIKTSSLAQSGAGDRVVYADENGVLKTGGSIASNNGVQNETGMTCTAANAGKINYTTIQKDGKDVGVFGFCMQKGTDYVWAYMLGGSNIYGTSANGAAFGQGL